MVNCFLFLAWSHCDWASWKIAWPFYFAALAPRLGVLQSCVTRISLFSRNVWFYYAPRLSMQSVKAFFIWKRYCFFVLTGVKHHCTSKIWSTYNRKFAGRPAALKDTCLPKIFISAFLNTTIFPLLTKKSDLYLTLQPPIEVHTCFIQIRGSCPNSDFTESLIRIYGFWLHQQDKFLGEKTGSSLEKYMHSFRSGRSEVIYTCPLNKNDNLATYCHPRFSHHTRTIATNLYISVWFALRDHTFFEFFLVFTVPLLGDGLQFIVNSFNYASNLQLTAFDLTDFCFSYINGVFILDTFFKNILISFSKTTF